MSQPSFQQLCIIHPDTALWEWSPSLTNRWRPDNCSNPLFRKLPEICFSKEPLQSLGLLALVKLYTRFLKTLSSVQFNHSVVSDSAIPWTTARQASLSITNSWSSPRLMSIESVMPCSHPILWRPLLLLPSIFPSIRVFSSESVLLIGWPNYWTFSFSISPSSEYSGLISFRIDWCDLLAVQGTLKSLLQHYSSKESASVLSFLFSPTFTSKHDSWKNHSFD